MRRVGGIAVLTAAALALSACGGGGSSGGGSPPAPPIPAPVVSLVAQPATVGRNGTTTLTWTSTNATSCTASGDWSGSRDANGSATLGPLAANASYSISCTGSGGSGSASTTVSFSPVPVITLTATPPRVLLGGISTLNWTTTDATSCTGTANATLLPLNGWLGAQPTSGSFTTQPMSSPTEFILECTGPAGTSRATARVEATPAGSIFFFGVPSSVYFQDAVTFRWSGSFVTDCVASGAWSGPRPANGEFTTPPLTANTSYTLTCTDAAGPVVRTLDIVPQVRPPPTVQLFATPASLTAGTSGMLQWFSTLADSCVASGAWTGPRSTSGSVDVGPVNATSTYTLTCTNTAGSSAASATITVTGPNQPPIADAGLDRNASWGDMVNLIGNGSDPGGSVAGYQWSQVAGPVVSLAGSNTSFATFHAPRVTTSTVLRFQLVVTDNLGVPSAPDFMDVVVSPPPGGVVTLRGNITYERIPFSATLGNGLDYNAIRREPARGVTVVLIDVFTDAVYAQLPTDGSGAYTAEVPGNKTLRLEVRAELVRSAPDPLPHWNIQVRDGHGSFAFLYGVASASFLSGGGATQDFNIPAGWDPVTRRPNGARQAAPFAILDTIYRSIDKILTVAPTADLPRLTIDWSPSNRAGETFYDDENGADTRFISLSGEADFDIDEYDPHTIAHEFGHYIEDTFGRSDSIGGQHGFGDTLDPRVAFGEGFGYAFAAIVLDDPQIRDAIGPGQSNETYFNVETDGLVNEGWFNESSVHEILWDLYDSSNDGSDSLSLGLAPLWAILTGPQRTTESFTTIFQFAAALKAANPAAAAQIDAIIGGEAIVAPTIEPFASTETNAAQSTDVLPVYTPIGVGTGAVSVKSIDRFGTYNKLSNRRFLRLQSASTQRVRITANTPGTRDPDVVVWSHGRRIAVGIVDGNEDFAVDLSPGTYILETYDCGNAECAGGGTGTFDISIAVTPF
ncbi:MAG TPA: hypothetical protein PK159_03250 [Steroidobacteraceae bacterium]|nr:hypothetical protein [Steroidobacteraceae bacterium]